MHPQDNKEPEIFFQGTTQEIVLPSTNVITIREQNGDDEDILSQVSAAETGDNIVQYLASVVTHSKETQGKPLTDVISKWVLKDKYYAIFKARILNYGPKFSWEHTCSNPKCEHHNHPFKATEDLTIFDGEFMEPDYKPKNQYAITKCPGGMLRIISLTLPSGIKVRYKLLNTELEKNVLAEGAESRNNSSSYRGRDLEMERSGTWEKVLKFSAFSSRDMAALRGSIQANDTLFAPITEIECPKCKTRDSFNVLLHPTFFYPAEI